MIEIVNFNGLDGIKSVDLYNKIGMHPWNNNYTRWWQDNSRHGDKNSEWWDFPLKQFEKGRPRKVYFITLEFAMDLCVLARTKEGKTLKNWLRKESKKGIL